MSKEQLDAFLEALKVDVNLQEKIYTAKKKEAVEAIAKEAGVNISAEALGPVLSEVSEDELENIVGSRGVTFIACAGTQLWNCKKNKASKGMKLLESHSCSGIGVKILEAIQHSYIFLVAMVTSN